MNIYYCETCGVRISDADVQGLDPGDERLKRCAQHRSGGVKIPPPPSSASAPVTRGSGAAMAPTRISSMRMRTQTKGPAGPAHASSRHGESETQPNLTLKIVAGLAALAVLVFGASLFSSSDKSTAASSKSSASTATQSAQSNSSIPQTQTAQSAPPQVTPDKGPVHEPVKELAAARAPEPVKPEPTRDPKDAANHAPDSAPMGFMSSDGGDIREDLAHDRLNDLLALEKDGKHTPQQLRIAYRKFIAANASTKAAREAESRLKALPAPPTYTIAGLKDGLVGCWSWDDDGPSAPDRSAHDADGEIDGATRTADNPPALSFDGNGNAVNMPAEPFREVTKSFTIMCWAKPSAGRARTSESTGGIDGTRMQRYAVFPTQGQMAYGEHHAGVGLSIGSNGVSVFEHSGGYMPATLVYDAPISDWTHVAVVYDNNKPSLYINGALVKDGIANSMTTHPGASLGGSSYGWYRGLLGEVRIYNRALSADEIKGIVELNRK